MKFNIDDYNGKYAMHCKTKEEAEDFCRYLDSIGRKWKNGNRYLKCTYWQSLKSETAYGLNEATYDCVGYYKDNGYTILEWSDFMNDPLTKNRIIENFFKILGIKPNECFSISGDDLSYYIDYELNIHCRSFNDEYKLNSNRSNDMIVDILREKKTIAFCPTKEEQLAIDYVKMCGFKWLAKDALQNVWAYKIKPHRMVDSWDCDEDFDVSGMPIYIPVYAPISFINWDDEEPYYIGD